MKLRNKKTGEVVEWFNNTSGIFPNTLTELNEEWEDVPEKPKKYWFIDAFGNIVQNEITKHRGDEYTDMTIEYENQKRIGNHFETEEEAEKAVDKLKAWKRLKDKGFRFNGLCESVYELPAIEYDLDVDVVSRDSQVHEDLDLLFGGEE